MMMTDNKLTWSSQSRSPYYCRAATANTYTQLHLSTNILCHTTYHSSPKPSTAAPPHLCQAVRYGVASCTELIDAQQSIGTGVYRPLGQCRPQTPQPWDPLRVYKRMHCSTHARWRVMTCDGDGAALSTLTTSHLSLSLSLSLNVISTLFLSFTLNIIPCT